VPGAISGSAAALVWLFMLTPEYSPFGPLLRAVGLQSSSETITSESLPVVLSVIATAVTAGGWIVVLYAALNALPEELLEAATLDGSSAWQTAWHIKLPLVKNYLALMLISSFAYGTQLFVEPQVMRSAFTGQISETWSVNQLAYFFATQEGDFGKAAALSLLLMLVGVLLAVLVMWRTDFYATDARRDGP
jgi:multiple sugar transport system permease protein